MKLLLILLSILVTACIIIIIILLWLALLFKLLWAAELLLLRSLLDSLARPRLPSSNLWSQAARRSLASISKTLLFDSDRVTFWSLEAQMRFKSQLDWLAGQDCIYIIVCIILLTVDGSRSVGKANKVVCKGGFDTVHHFWLDRFSHLLLQDCCKHPFNKLVIG